jgi:hypothetical protein
MAVKYCGILTLEKIGPKLPRFITAVNAVFYCSIFYSIVTNTLAYQDNEKSYYDIGSWVAKSFRNLRLVGGNSIAAIGHRHVRVLGAADAAC